MISRRQFISRSSSLIALSPLVPTMLCRAAEAATAKPDAKVLVVIQLDGGNDGINTVVPYSDDGYNRARNKIRLEARELHKLNDQVGLHPQMRSAKSLFDDGRLAVVQGVGYPNPDRSHFRSMRIWQTASMDDSDHNTNGWLGQSLDSKPIDQAAGEASAIYVGAEQTPVALWGRRSTATALSRMEDLTLQGDFGVNSNVGPNDSLNESMQQFVTRQVLSAFASAEQFKQQERAQKVDQSARYPDNALGARLALMARLLKSGSQARVFYTSQSGYDTHAAQLQTHANLLSELSSALKAFLDDLRSAKLEDRVLVMAFSEFGRRVEENDSQGTDHGTAGPVFLAGPAVTPGLHGATPSLSKLTDGDLTFAIDFREIYATIVDQWLDLRRPASLRGCNTFSLLRSTV
jgi:uncharacterized protein (DUF1501 family)